MLCIDCQRDGKIVVCIYDLKERGHVCERCHRVYSNEHRGRLHYASERGCKNRINRDIREKKEMSVGLEALTRRILKSENG